MAYYYKHKGKKKQKTVVNVLDNIRQLQNVDKGQGAGPAMWIISNIL